MEVILKKDVQNIGEAGDIVTVKDKKSMELVDIDFYPDYIL